MILTSNYVLCCFAGCMIALLLNLGLSIAIMRKCKHLSNFMGLDENGDGLIEVEDDENDEDEEESIYDGLDLSFDLDSLPLETEEDDKEEIERITSSIKEGVPVKKDYSKIEKIDDIIESITHETDIKQLRSLLDFYKNKQDEQYDRVIRFLENKIDLDF